MRRIATNFAAALAILTCASVLQAAPSQGLLDDGEFNNPDHQTDVSNSAWVLTASKPDTVDLAARFQLSGFARNDGAGGAGGGVWIRSFEGNQGGGGDPLAQATLSQSIVAPVAGQYVLDFDWARETYFSAGTFDVSLSSSGTGGSDTVDLNTAVGNAGNFNELLVNFGGPNSSTLTLNGVTAGDTLTVTARMIDGVDSLANPQSAFLDGFNLRAVPEPGTIALVCLGTLGLIGVGRRR